MTLPSPHFPTTSNLRRSETETVVYGNQRFSIRLERNDFIELILMELGSIPDSLFSLFLLFSYKLLTITIKHAEIRINGKFLAPKETKPSLHYAKKYNSFGLN